MWNIMPQRLKNKILESCTFVGSLALTSCTFTKTKHTPTEYAVDGAVDPLVDAAVLSKGTAGAYTLAAPAASQDGHIIRITSNSAAAHVITATGLLHDGVTGGAKNTATFAAFHGASITLMAWEQKWYVLNKNVVTVAA